MSTEEQRGSTLALVHVVTMAIDEQLKDERLDWSRPSIVTTTQEVAEMTVIAMSLSITDFDACVPLLHSVITEIGAFVTIWVGDEPTFINLDDGRNHAYVVIAHNIAEDAMRIVNALYDS